MSKEISAPRRSSFLSLKTSVKRKDSQRSGKSSASRNELSQHSLGEDEALTAAEVALEGGKKLALAARGIVDAAGIPFAKGVLDLGLTILEAFETLKDNQSGCQRLRSQLTTILFAIAHTTEETDERNRLEKELIRLNESLQRIKTRLDTIQRQGKFKGFILSATNAKAILECEKDFQNSLDSFQVLQLLDVRRGLTVIKEHLSAANPASDSKPKVSFDPMLRSQGELYGRDEIIQSVADLVCSNDSRDSRVCIIGPGGMGKTSTALAVMNHDLVQSTFAPVRQYRVPCIEANSLDNLLALLFHHVRAQTRTNIPLDDIITSLQETSERCIILLDNFETPLWEIPHAEDKIRPILEALQALQHVSILVTMRADCPPQLFDKWKNMKLGPIDPQASNRLYTSIDEDASEYPEQLSELLDSLGHLPYAVKLMATRGYRSHTDPGRLLQEWREHGTDMLSKIDLSIKLSVESKLIKASVNATLVLQILSLLPAGVEHKSLSIWAGDRWSSQAIEVLRDSALIVTRTVCATGTKKTYHHSVLPVVQSYMNRGDRISPEVKASVYEACWRFLKQNNAALSGPNHPAFREHVAAIATQEANIHALVTDVLKDELPQSPSPTDLLDALLIYINYQRWTRPRLEVALRVVSLSHTLVLPRHEAASLFCLGHMLYKVDRVREAVRVFEEARKTYEAVEDEVMALESQFMRMEVSLWNETYDAPLDLELTGSLSQRKDRNPFPPVLRALSLYHRGYLNWYFRQWEDALVCLEKAEKAYALLGQPYERTNCLQLMARSHACMGNFDKALEFIGATLDSTCRLFGEELQGPNLVYLGLLNIRYLKGAGCWTEEMEAALQSILQAARDLGLSGLTAALLLELGEVNLKKGDLDAARENHEEAVRKCAGLDGRPANLTNRSRAEHNLRYIDHIQHGLVEEVEFWTPRRH